MRTVYLGFVIMCSLGIGGYGLVDVLFAANTPPRGSVPGLYDDPNWSRFQDPEDYQGQILWQGPGWYSGSWYENEEDYKNGRGSSTGPTGKESDQKKTPKGWLYVD